MKKLFALCLAALLLLTLFLFVSCDEKNSDDEKKSCKPTWGEWSTVLEPTCGAEGEQKRVCSKCEEEESNSLPVGGVHTVSGTSCTVCGESATEGLLFTVTNEGEAYRLNGFGGETTVTDVIIPATHNGKPVTGIASGAFKNCSSIVTVTIPDSVTSIGSDAFYRCTKLEKISMPASLKSVGFDAFSLCEKLSAVYIDDLTAWCEVDLDSSPFENGADLYINNLLTRSIVIPDTVTEILESAFEGANITDVAIPASVEYIEKSAFHGCEYLTSVTIAENSKLQVIDLFAFWECSSLFVVTIPASVEYIEDMAFDDCDALKIVYYAGDESDFRRIDIGYFNDSLCSAKIYYYSAEEPSLPDSYWHYGENGEILVWQ